MELSGLLWNLLYVPRVPKNLLELIDNPGEFLRLHGASGAS